MYTQNANSFRSTDFRDVYGTILKHWLNMPQATVQGFLPLDSAADAISDPAHYWRTANFDLTRIPVVCTHPRAGGERHPAMTLADYYLGDPRLILVPIEHLGAGRDEPRARRAARERGWLVAGAGRCSSTAASRSTGRAAPRSRVARARGCRRGSATSPSSPTRARRSAIRAAAEHQRLDCSTRATSIPRSRIPSSRAYLLAHGDRMALSGEVTLSALHNAAWWLERSDDECAAFAAAAARSTRPDAAAFRAVADGPASGCGSLRHETLRPPLIVEPAPRDSGDGAARAAGARATSRGDSSTRGPARARRRGRALPRHVAAPRPRRRSASVVRLARRATRRRCSSRPSADGSCGTRSTRSASARCAASSSGRTRRPSRRSAPISG